MGLRKKMILCVNALILAAVLILSFSSYLSLNSAYKRVVAATEEKLDAIIQAQVECMIGALTANYERYQNGDITEKQAKETAENLVRSTRYNNGVGYFWADMADGTSAVHIKPEVEGTNRFNTQDEAGNYFVQDTIKAGDKPDGGFIDFYFTKPGENTAKPKRGYVKKFEPYGWYIGTGNYEEDMMPLIQAELNNASNAKKLSVISLWVGGIAVLIFSACIMVIFAGKIINPLKKAIDRLEKLSEGNLHDAVEVSKTKDEVGILTHALSKTIQSFCNYIDNISYVLGNMDKGNLDIKIDLEYAGDFQPIKSSLTNTINAFNKALLGINESAREVASGSDQVSSAAQALAQGTTEQASSIEQLSSTISEISQQVKESASDAKKANEVAEKAKEQMLEGSKMMSEMISAMEKINNSSGEIGKIIKTIEDIAFQTNILALNAAVEAARAGQAGKGFAVVADEVRNLAEKSAQATKSTTALIEGSIQAIEDGTEIARNTSSALEMIVESANQTADFMNSIASTADKQATAVSQVTLGIEQISAVVQTNAATAEETSASSGELSKQAKILKELVMKFQLNDMAR